MLSHHYRKFRCKGPSGEEDHLWRVLAHSAAGGIVSFCTVCTVSRGLGECGEGEMLLRQAKVFQ